MGNLGEDAVEVERSYEKQGITGEINRYNKESMQYPSITIINTEDNGVPKHKLKILPNMFASPIAENSNVIYIYFKQGDTVVKLGRISDIQVKTFLKLFDGYNLLGMLNKDKELIGDYLYILSN